MKRSKLQQLVATYNGLWYSNEEQNRKRFNKAINKSALYLRGEKVIPFQEVKRLSLGFRSTQKYVSYEKAYSKFVKKYC